MKGDEHGVLHRHEDGRVHQHFSEGFTIGNQVIPDHDGTESHHHGTLNIAGGESNRNQSGPVVAFFSSDFYRCHKCRAIAIAPQYDQCESCEYGECPGCGVKVLDPGFCSHCQGDGTSQSAISASERWATLAGYTR